MVELVRGVGQIFEVLNQDTEDRGNDYIPYMVVVGDRYFIASHYEVDEYRSSAGLNEVFRRPENFNPEEHHGNFIEDLGIDLGEVLLESDDLVIVNTEEETLVSNGDIVVMSVGTNHIDEYYYSGYCQFQAEGIGNYDLESLRTAETFNDLSFDLNQVKKNRRFCYVVTGIPRIGKTITMKNNFKGEVIDTDGYAHPIDIVNNIKEGVAYIVGKYRNVNIQIRGGGILSYADFIVSLINKTGYDVVNLNFDRRESIMNDGEYAIVINSYDEEVLDVLNNAFDYIENCIEELEPYSVFIGDFSNREQEDDIPCDYIYVNASLTESDQPYF